MWKSLIYNDINSILKLSAAAVNGPIINTKKLLQQETAVQKLEELKDYLDQHLADINELVEIVGGRLNAAKCRRVADITSCKELMSKTGLKVSAEVSRPPKEISKQIENISPPKTEIATYTYGNFEKIRITDTIKITAVRVPNFAAVQPDGRLYFVEANNHFALILNSMLIHGNIGNIYTDNTTPEKIKSCRFRGNCMKSERCDYYHSPDSFPNSRDTRNFVANSWVYTTDRNKMRYGSRRFGSRERMDVDIVALQSDEIERFIDQSMHDLLCSIILREYFMK